MSRRVLFEPKVMDQAAARLDHGAQTNHDLMAQIGLVAAPSADVPDNEYAIHMEPRLTEIRRHAADRRRALREIANFIRARATLARVADGVGGAKGKVKGPKGILPQGAGVLIGELNVALGEVARHMEREFLDGGWLDKNGKLNGRTGSPKGLPHSWSRLAKISKRLPLIGKADTVAQMFDALFGKKSTGHRAEALGGVVGSFGAGTAASVAAVAFMTGPPGMVGLVALGAGIVGAELGTRAGKYVGKNVIKPLWNGVKDIGKSLADLGAKGLGLLGRLIPG
jgi:hypothetical protein